MTTNEQTLRREITLMSADRTDWEITKMEWELDKIHLGVERCLCGHNPIKEICTLKNKYNQKLAIVGNCCVKKFMGIDTGTMFDVLKRVIADHTKNLTAEVVIWAWTKKWINDWEHNFYIDILSRGKKLSLKQTEKKISINDKIVKWVKKDETGDKLGLMEKVGKIGHLGHRKNDDAYNLRVNRANAVVNEFNNWLDGIGDGISVNEQLNRQKDAINKRDGIIMRSEQPGVEIPVEQLPSGGKLYDFKEIIVNPMSEPNREAIPPEEKARINGIIDTITSMLVICGCTDAISKVYCMQAGNISLGSLTRDYGISDVNLSILETHWRELNKYVQE